MVCYHIKKRFAVCFLLCVIDMIYRALCNVLDHYVMYVFVLYISQTIGYAFGHRPYFGPHWLYSCSHIWKKFDPFATSFKGVTNDTNEGSVPFHVAQWFANPFISRIPITLRVYKWSQMNPCRTIWFYVLLNTQSYISGHLESSRNHEGSLDHT